MSFLKKHWRFTLSAVIVLCVLLVGAVVMYSTGEPPEPETVYVMPERNPDNPPPINIGGIATATPAQSGETTNPAVSPTQEVVSDTESLESCCPEEELLDENASAESAPLGYHVHHSPSPEAIEDAKKYKEWMREYLAHEEKDTALSDKWLRLVNESVEIGKIFHNGEQIDIFDVILHEPDRLSKSETLAYLKQVQSKFEEHERKKASAWEQLQDWRRNRPVEPTYKSVEYTTTSHE